RGRGLARPADDGPGAVHGGAVGEPQHGQLLLAAHLLQLRPAAAGEQPEGPVAVEHLGLVLVTVLAQRVVRDAARVYRRATLVDVAHEQRQLVHPAEATLRASPVSIASRRR